VPLKNKTNIKMASCLIDFPSLPTVQNVSFPASQKVSDYSCHDFCHSEQVSGSKQWPRLQP